MVAHGLLFNLDELVPLRSSLFIQETLWNPGQEVCRIVRLLTLNEQ